MSYMEADRNKREDIEIIRRVLQGDSDAFGEIVQKYNGLVYSIVLKLVGNPTDAEDLVQEIFVKIYRGLEMYNGEFAMTTWIMKIASNHTIDFLRKKKLKTTSIHDDDEKEQEKRPRQFRSDLAHPDERLEQKEIRKMLEEAIQKLPPKYREVIILRHKEEKDYTEIARMLNLPLGTVKARIFRAREMLNKILKDKI